MKSLQAQMSFVLLVWMLLGSRASQAQDADVDRADGQDLSTWSDANREFDAMRAELAALRTQIEQLRIEEPVEYWVTQDVVAARGWQVEAGFEMVVVQPYFEDGIDVDRLVDPHRQIEPGYEFHVTPRFWVGYWNRTNGGVRARYWQFDQNAELTCNPCGETAIHGLAVTAADVEFVQFLSSDVISLELAAGVRFAKVEANLIENPGDPLRTNWFHADFEGIGPTVAIEAQRPLGASRWAIVGNARGSAVFGTDRILNVSAGTVNIDRLDKDDLIFVLESQVGVQYRRPLGNHGVLLFRALMEGQVWGLGARDPADMNATSVDETFGFFGGTASFIYLH
jgi:hypothetical protein